jgi:hypothetical protein
VRPDFSTLDVKHDATPGPDSEGDALLVDRFLDHTVQVVGAFTGSLRLEASNDGTTWVQLAALTAPGITHYEGTYRYLRLRTAALSAGTPTAHYGGMDQRVE